MHPRRHSMGEPSSPFANGSREAVRERSLDPHPRSSLCPAFSGASPHGGPRQLRLGNSSCGEYRGSDRLVRGDPHRTATAATSRAALTLALPTPGNNLSPRASAAIKTPCAERGHTTHSSHPPSPLQVLFVLKTLLLSVLVPRGGAVVETSRKSSHSHRRVPDTGSCVRRRNPAHTTA